MPVMQGRFERQGSQGLVLGWILRNRKRWQQWRSTGEVVATMASLPAKNLPWQTCDVATTVVVLYLPKIYLEGPVWHFDQKKL